MRIGEGLRHDHTRLVDTEMELLPPTLAVSPVCRGGPRALAHDRQVGALDDEMDGVRGRDATEHHSELLTPPRACGVVRRVQIGAHQGQDRPHEPLRLAQGQAEDEPEDQRGLDRHIREPLLPTGATGGRRSPRVRGSGREPQGHVTSVDERSLVLPPVPDAIRGLVFRMHLRLHKQDRALAAATGPAG